MVVPPARLTLRAGFVLAGGRSQRMGRDKALLPWQGRTLLQHAVERLREVCAEVRVLGAAAGYEEAGAPVVPDGRPGLGPLAGLETALGLVEAGEATLVLGVDLPFVPPELLRELARLAPDHDVVAPVLPLGPEPLCAVYRATCLPAVRRALDEGRRRMTAFWDEVSVRALGPEALARFGDPALVFRNLNTTSEYEAARRP